MTILNIEMLVKLVSTAQAVYENVLGGGIQDVIGATDAGFTEIQQLDFESRFGLMLDSGISTSSGFQAVIFQPSNSAHKIFAIRGGEEQ